MISNTVPNTQLRVDDESVFESLFLAHYSRVYGVAYRLLGQPDEAEDIAQRVFIKLYQRPPQVDDENSLIGWLYRVTSNESYNALRSRKRRLFWHDTFSNLWPFSQNGNNPADIHDRHTAVVAYKSPCKN